MKKFKMKYFYTLLFFVLIFIDRASKFWALNVLKEKSISLFKYLDFSLVFNRGVSFGVLSSSSPIVFYLLTAVIFLVIIFFVIFLFTEAKRGVNVFWHTFIAAGAYSNLIDRFLYKGVVDFIDFHIYSWHWPTFNIADAFIVIGVFAILGGMFKNAYFRKN